MVVLCFVYILFVLVLDVYFFLSSRRRHTSCALVTGVQTCALPIHTPTLAIECLVNVPPEQRFDAAETVQHLEQRLRVVQPDAVHPATEIGRASCRERVCQYV